LPPGAARAGTLCGRTSATCSLGFGTSATCALPFGQNAARRDKNSEYTYPETSSINHD
jgi:hypothetical protein